MTAEAAAQVDPTESGRWIVIDGRRWRATDPSIPEPLRQELVNNLMAARRGVGSARRAGDDAAERLARAQVDDAKFALGERGEPWWEPPSEGGRRRRARATVRALSGGRAPDRTICPSDVARAIGGPSWRSILGMVRDEVRTLAYDNVVEVSQRGKPLDPDRAWKGPIRIRRTG